MAKQSRRQKISDVRTRGQAVHDAHAFHPDVESAVQKAADKAFAIYTQKLHERSDQVKRGLMLDGVPGLGLMLDGLPGFQFDAEVPPFAPDDPFRDERQICRDHGLRLMIYAGSDGRPMIRMGLERDEMTVRVLRAQRLSPLPRWVMVEIDLHAPRARLIRDFEAVAEHLRASRTAVDAAPTRQWNAAKLRRAIEMLRAYQVSWKWTQVAKQFRCSARTAQRSVENLCRDYGHPMPDRRAARREPEVFCRTCPDPDPPCRGCRWSDEVRMVERGQSEKLGPKEDAGESAFVEPEETAGET
jgi:hypothetical protein